MKVYSECSFANLYQALLIDLMTEPSFISFPRGLKTHEITQVFMELKCPLNNLFRNDIRSVPKRYLAGELIWYFAGSNDSNYIVNYSKLWNKIKNADGTINSAYGYILFTEKNETGLSEYEWALQSLIRDIDTRQAVLRFSKPYNNYYGNKDFVCTLTGGFLIRDNRLFFTVHQRSSDAITGITFDLPFFTILHQQMLVHLKEKYTQLELGSLYLFINSSHIYSKHFDLATEMIECGFIDENLPPLNESLINQEGTSCSEILHLYQGETIQTNDELLIWLDKNSKCDK